MCWNCLRKLSIKNKIQLGAIVVWELEDLESLLIVVAEEVEVEVVVAGADCC